MSIAFEIFERVARASKDVGQAPAAPSRDVHPFDERNIHPEISTVSKKLFDDGHYSQATFEAFKFLDNKVKTLSGIQESGFSLMMNAFNEKGPKIQLTDLATVSEKDEQIGYRYIFAGTMAGIRNPRGHENLVDPIDLCLDHLSLASVLMRRLDVRKTP
ncbi:TIGR02391 family protein [Mesorhizobium sp. M6A.T.Ca.TU.002.02.2.1]|uniref:TIGR02391 family protein n=1 Tax=Mesorhizobium sp. M6A.T.Ce.TU.016.01.1.1 TaxID=2496783 RepID=UPI000FCA8465|nr:TIGR02391 family protein [Mesorhizobium sp. M6A.T.Ce.TU.016.01.1.1]RUU24081.1 TIGR02391 family protein [Mesorhizobium sp. M6A.T.Ca.TU.002.02.2.1]RUU26015.1 TIGR02391 family protein [Mesorhizobium sp. M6A.T.Ce.TU.016.01.1.1]